MKGPNSTHISTSYSLALLGLFFGLFYFWGYLFPDFWWTTHWLAFLSPLIAILVGGIAGVFLFYPFFNQRGFNLTVSPNSLPRTKQTLAFGLVACLAGCAMCYFSHCS